MTRPTRPVSAILVTLAVATAAVLGAGPAPTPAPAPATGQAVAAPITATVGGDVKREMTEVPVRRVVLFSSGVGFFQHAGKVTGNAATELRFKTDQINDILKSLVVGDSAGGDVKSITYGSQNPVARTLKSFQIDISSNPTMAGILNQIRGSKVTVTMPDEKVEGTILGVEEKDRPVGPADNPNLQRVIKVSYVNLITSTGIRSVQLEEVKRLQIQDEALQKELDQALAALAQARDKDKKPVIVNFDGTGERNVGIAYLVETPVWKTSYRLILPDPTSQDSATLLGWAIVENQTDNDWNNITLDLVGGRPISFIQDLYQPLYVPRPKVASKTYASLTPQTYDDGVDTTGAQPAQPGQPAPPAGGRGGRGGAGGGGGGAGGGAGGGRGGGGAGGAPGAGQGGGGFGGAGGPADAPAEPPPMDYAQGVKSIADAGKVGEMFQYSVKGVSLPRQRSSMIPIITSPVAFDRVSIYNRSVLARNALSGVRLKNQSANYLLAGPLVVLDKVKKADGQIVESYAGDATVDDVPAGQERLLSFAIDQELLVDSNKRDPHVRVTSTSIIKGVLNFKYTDSMQQQYVLENKGDRDKQVVIEDPITVGYELKAPAKALEKTDKVYRFQVVAPAKKTVLFDVIEEKPRLETVAILPMDAATMESYSRTGDIPANVRAVLAKAAEKRRALTEVQRKLDQREQDRSRIFQDQANIRENIKVLPAGSNSAQIAITDLTTKDTERKQADADIKELQAAVEKARGELEGYLGDMTVE